MPTSAGTTYSAGDVLNVYVPFLDDGANGKVRPVLVVSTEAYNRYTDCVMFVPITSTTAPGGTYYLVELEKGHMPFSCNAISDQVFTTNQSQVKKKFGKATTSLLNKVLRDVKGNLA